MPFKIICIVLTGTSDPFEVSRMVEPHCDGGRSPIGILSERFPSNGRPSSSGRRQRTGTDCLEGGSYGCGASSTPPARRIGVHSRPGEFVQALFM